jgi:hypothetical protein
MLNEGYQIHKFISSSGSGTVINYSSGSTTLDAGTDQLGIKEHLVASFLLAVAIFFQVFPLLNSVFDPHCLQMPIWIQI